MEKLLKQIVNKLIENNQTISCMESCTGGFLAHQITNIEGSSNVLKVSLVTYSNEYKIEFGVNKETIQKYSVYSIETANEMAKKVSEFAKSDWGIGVTGQLGIDEGYVYYSIYDNATKQIVNNTINIGAHTYVHRPEQKQFVAETIFAEVNKCIKTKN